MFLTKRLTETCLQYYLGFLNPVLSKKVNPQQCKNCRTVSWMCHPSKEADKQAEAPGRDNHHGRTNRLQGRTVQHSDNRTDIHPQDTVWEVPPISTKAHHVFFDFRMVSLTEYGTKSFGLLWDFTKVMPTWFQSKPLFTTRVPVQSILMVAQDIGSERRSESDKALCSHRS